MASSSNGDISTRYIYILELENGHYYTGYTIDMERRWLEHVTGRNGARYTSSFKPVRILQCWQFEGTIGQALKVERLIKHRKRAFKQRILQSPEKLEVTVHKKIDDTISLQLFPSLKS
ncbi:GIY-YIG nuclease family protein [candidate division KSB1 bacterium]|nr:GIY-YIG nuclease family protein [candidate division KSB1 bacterium]